MKECSICETILDDEVLGECAECREPVCFECMAPNEHGEDFCSDDCIDSWEEENE